MADFLSEVKTIPYNDDKIFAMLSDLSNLERFKESIPQDTIKDLLSTPTLAALPSIRLAR